MANNYNKIGIPRSRLATFDVIHNTIHSISFGIGSVVKKPLVVNNEIRVREVLNATILLDHDVIDGAPMVRFVKGLTKNIEDGVFLEI